MPYNATALSACADYICWFKEVNAQSSIAGVEAISTMIVIGSFLLPFILTSRNSSSDSLLVSSFFAFIVSAFLAIGQLLNPIVAVMALIVFGASVVLK